MYNKKRKVAVYDKNNNLIKTYNSVRDCKKDYLVELKKQTCMINLIIL